MAKRRFTANERAVLAGLVRYPSLGDRQLAERVGVKTSTLTAIRRRLWQRGYFRTRRLPAVHRLGWELLLVGYGRFGPQGQPATVARVVKDLVPRHPAIFHWAVAGDQTLLLACERNYTALRDTVDGVQARLTKLGLLGEQPWRFVVLPFARTALSSLFDYGALVGAGPKDGHRPLSLEPPTGSDVSLRRKEAQVLEGLVRYPELSDKALSGRIGVSRQAISRMRQAFEANGLVRTVRVLDLKKLGHEILTVVHATFRPNSPLARRRDEVRFVATRLPQFLLAAGNTESVVLAAMRSYEEYTAIRGELLRFYREQDLLQTEPQIQLLPVADLVHYREVDFGPVLQGYGRP